MSQYSSKDPSHHLAEYAIINYQGLSYFKEPFNCSQELFFADKNQKHFEFSFKRQNVAPQGQLTVYSVMQFTIRSFAVTQILFST